MSKKHSESSVREFIEKERCKWIGGEYKDCKTPIDILFPCGHSDKRSFGSFKNKEKLCTSCISKSKGRVPRGSWNLDTMNKYCSSNKTGYLVLDLKQMHLPYQNQLWALVKCPNDNHPSYWAWWNNIKKGYLCDACYIEKYNITQWNKEKIESFYSSFGLSIMNFEEWKDVDSYIYCTNNDGYYVRANISNLKVYRKHPKWGPNLFNGNKYAIQNIKIFCKKERPDYDIVSDEYAGIKNYHLFIYNGAGLPDGVDRKFYTTIDSFYHGLTRHPFLNKTKSETRIENFLVNHGIFYKFQYTDHDCKNDETGWKLRFDFGIFNENNDLEMIIESDGTSHDKAVEYWGGEENLKSIQKRDKIKDKYCCTNDIRLLRINHKDDKFLEIILEKELLFLFKERRTSF
jgi:hypothetical protein